MSSPALPEEQLKILPELENQTVELRAKAQSLDEEAKQWAEKRDGLNGQCKKIWDEVKELKAHRDELNNQIRKLKEERDSLHTLANPKREKLEALRKKMGDLPSRTRSTRSLARRIEELDWEIQTNPLTLAQEKELIGRIKALEEEMLTSKEASAVKDKIIELRTESASLRVTANDLHGKVTELAKQSQELHERMLAKIKEAKAIKPEADEAHKMFSSLRSQAEEAFRGYLETMTRAKAIRLQARMERENEKKRRIEAAMNAGSEEAMRKLKEKRKITLDEFKILKAKGLI